MNFFSKLFNRPKKTICHYVLPFPAKEITVYYDGSTWFDNLVDSDIRGLDNKYPMLIRGIKWNKREFETFSCSKDIIVDNQPKIMYLDEEFIYTTLCERLIANPLVKLHRGFYKVNRLIPNTYKYYSKRLNEQLTSVSWLVDDELTLGMLIHNMDKKDDLYKMITEHLMECPQINTYIIDPETTNNFVYNKS